MMMRLIAFPCLLLLPLPTLLSAFVTPRTVTITPKLPLQRRPGQLKYSTFSSSHRPVDMPAGVQAPVVEMNSESEFKDFLAQDDRICVVKFHAAWCKSCKKFGLKYQGLANEISDWVDADNSQQIIKEGSMRLAAIEFGANKDLCKSLNIKKLPTVHFYQNGKKLAGFPCGPAKFQLLQDTVNHYLRSQQDEPKLEQTLSQGDALMKSPEVSQEYGQSEGLRSYEQQLAQAYAVAGTGSDKDSSVQPGKKLWWHRG